MCVDFEISNSSGSLTDEERREGGGDFTTASQRNINTRTLQLLLYLSESPSNHTSQSLHHALQKHHLCGFKNSLLASLYVICERKKLGNWIVVAMLLLESHSRQVIESKGLRKQQSICFMSFYESLWRICWGFVLYKPAQMTMWAAVWRTSAGWSFSRWFRVTENVTMQIALLHLTTS